MLYQPERHFPLDDRQWSPARVRSFADRLFLATDQAYSESGFWKAHPLDLEAGEQPYLLNAYVGASGVAWGLYRWRELTGHELVHEPAMILTHILENEEWDSYPSLFFGEAGDRMFLEAVKPGQKNREALERAFLRLGGSDTNEIMAGAPGALIAAQALYERSPDIDLKEQIDRLTTSIFASWQFLPEEGVYAWKQNYGQSAVYVGAAHGAVGNIFSLFRAWEHLSSTQLELLHTRAAEFLKRTAIRDGDLVNWPVVLPAGASPPLVQWCSGAPGVLILLAEHLGKGTDPELDQLLLGAGELVWRAGGLHKGASLCHGTAGSGAAMLKLFARTQDELWLDRARLFAMNLMSQIEALEKQYGQLRYSLWTGDIGAALFLLACEDGKFVTPMLDVIY